MATANPNGPPNRGAFRQAFLISALSVGLLSLISIGGVGVEALFFVWFVGAVVWGMLLVATIVAAIIGRQAVAGGLLAGLAVGFVALFASCFANLSAF